MKTTLLALFTISIIAVSCSSGDDDGHTNSSSETDIELVTGLNLRNSEFSDIYRLGNPNVFSDDLFIAYPNPTLGVLNIRAYSEISAVWITPSQANKKHQQTDFSSILTSSLYDEATIASLANKELTDLSATNLIMNLNELKTGYYKVFVKINGNIYWENIFFQDNNTDIEDLISYWEYQ